MVTDNPFSDEYVPPPPKDQAPQVPISANPFEPLPAAPGGADTSLVAKPTDKPYSTFNTAGRMATDALFGLPDTINAAARGLNYGIDRGIQAVTGAAPPGAMSRLVTGAAVPSYNAIPYLAPIARKAVGVAELPEDAGLGRSLAESAGSALLGGAGSAVGRGIVRGAAALPGAIAKLDPLRPIKNVTEDALEASGKNWYNTLDNLDVRYTPETGPDMANAINQGLFKPKGISEVNAGPALSNVDQLRAIDPAANVPYGVTKDYIVPRDIEGVRQSLNSTRAAPSNPQFPRTKEAANTAIGGIDQFLHNPPPGRIHPTSVNDPTLVGPVLANARADTAAAHRLGFLRGTSDEIGTKFAAKPTASGSSEAQALRDRSAAALNASRGGGGPLYGFSDYEQQLIEKASKASLLSKIGASAPQSVLPTIMQSLGAGATAHLAGLPPWLSTTVGIGLPGVQYAAKKLGDIGTRRAYQRAEEAIAARSPLAQSLGIPAPPTARLSGPRAVTRADITAALMAGSGAMR